jgi:cell division protein FtsW (lipid II flippase)
VSGADPDLLRSWAQRRPERYLLGWCLLCMTLGYTLVLGSVHAGGRGLAGADLLPLLTYALSLVGVHLVLVAARFRGDQVLVAAVAFLAGFGLLAQYRLGAFDGADARTLERYLFPGGVLVMLATVVAFMGGRYRALAQGPWVWGGLSLALVTALLFTGQRFRGGVYATGYTTPTEVLKLSIVLFLTGFIGRHAQALGQWHQRYPFLPPLDPLRALAAFWAALGALLAVQRDLGMIVILSVTLLAMLVAATRRIGYLVYGVLGAGGLGYLLFAVFSHGRRRIEAWRDPFEDPTGDGWQILQGLSGMYSGGLWGEGFGQGSPGYTPIASSDFIYSVVGEELGFVGCVVVVLFFLIVFARGMRIAEHSANQTGMLLATGLTAAIATQTFLNIGGVTKFVPLTGITLPFISHGGASLLTGFAALGLLLAISDTVPNTPRQTRQPAPKPSRPVQAPTAAPAKPRPAPKRKRTPKRTPEKVDGTGGRAGSRPQWPAKALAVGSHLTASAAGVSRLGPPRHAPAGRGSPRRRTRDCA